MTDLALTKESLDTDAQRWAAKVQALQIVDAESCTHAGQLLRSIKAVRANVARWFEPHLTAAAETKRKAEAARKGLADEQARIEAPLVIAEGTIKRMLVEWDTRQEQLRIAEQRRLQAEAQREAERITLDVAAALEADAEAAHDPAMRQEAHDILAQPIEAPVVTVASGTPKMEGVYYRDQWKAAADVDVRALARAVADGTAPVTFLAANMSALHAFARATQGTQAVPGVRFWNDRSLAARA